MEAGERRNFWKIPHRDNLRQACLVKEWNGQSLPGSAGLAVLGKVVFGWVWIGMVRQAGRGTAWCGMERLGTAGEARSGQVS